MMKTIHLILIEKTVTIIITMIIANTLFTVVLDSKDFESSDLISF